jgi:hypothetical protein
LCSCVQRELSDLLSFTVRLMLDDGNKSSYTQSALSPKPAEMRGFECLLSPVTDIPPNPLAFSTLGTKQDLEPGVQTKCQIVP